MGEDGASLDRLVAIMLQGIRELTDRIEKLEKINFSKG